MRALARKRAAAAAAIAAKENGNHEPYTDPTGEPDSTLPQVADATTGSGGGGSTGGGEVPEPTFWMGLVGCAAVMFAGNRWRRRTT